MSAYSDRSSPSGRRLPPLNRENSGGSDEDLAKHRYSPIENPFRGTGPSYSVKGVKHVLPAPGKLKPYMDTKAGVLDTWPAHATGMTSTMQVALSKNREMVLLDEEKMGKPQITPKPKFLENLENFLKKELKSLGVVKVEPNELRLQAHREVFEYLIEDFKTYKPLLAAIKNEYEMMLSYQRDHIRQLDPLKQMLVTVSEQCEQKIMKLQDEEKQEMTNLKRENSRLHKVIDDIKNDQASLQAQVERLQHKLSEQYERYRDEADARKLLVSDINDLRYQQEDLLLQQQQASNADKEEDPVLMRIALKKSREDEKNATARLNDMIANYGDVIPRRDFEALQKLQADTKSQLDTKDRDFEVLKAEHDTLLEVHKQVIKQRDDFYQEGERLRQSGTPRPDWEKCADFVPGGIQRWLDISQGKSSSELVDILLQELVSGVGGDTGAPEYFEGQGESEEVPAYLRFDGQVRNRHLGKRDTALLIKDIWKEKAVADAEAVALGGKRILMPVFLLNYLQHKFPMPQMVVEWAYNLHDACQRFAHDERISIFLGILTEEIDEEVYFGQLQTIARLLGHFTKAAEGLEPQGQLNKAQFREAINSFFNSEKEEADIDSLVKAGEQELEASEHENIEFTNLFLEDDEGKFGPFVDELKRQLEKEKLLYVNEIMKELGTENLKITSDDLQTAVTVVDPEIDTVKLDALMIWAFRVKTKDDLDLAEPLSVEDIEQRLINGAIKPTGKK